MLLHFSKWLSEHGYLPSCWSTERKHNEPKRWVNAITNTSIAFDRAAFRDVSSSHITRMKNEEETPVPGQVPPLKTPSNEVLEHLTTIFGQCEFQGALSARVSDHVTVAVGDVVVGYTPAASFVGKIVGHIGVNGDGGNAVFSLLETWTCTKATADYSFWNKSDARKSLVYTDDIVTALIYSEMGQSVVTLSSGRARRPGADTPVASGAA